jgi:hypothetical protein
MGDAVAAQVLAHGEAGLAAADDEHVHSFNLHTHVPSRALRVAQYARPPAGDAAAASAEQARRHLAGNQQRWLIVNRPFGG